MSLAMPPAASLVFPSALFPALFPVLSLASSLAMKSILALSLSLTLGCFAIPSADAPLGKLVSQGIDESAEPLRPLVVMLPGMGDRMEDFAEAGFIDPEVSRDFDVIAVDAHFGYYRERNLVPRLHEDIIAPARAAGYRRIWLLGISMGGFGSLLYASQYPDEIAGVIILSPFLGSPKLIRAIEAAGGLRSWENTAAKTDGPHDKEFDQHELDLWHWLEEQTAKSSGTPVILGYGRGERMARVYGPLLQVLEPCRVYVREGGHKWSTWKPLWARISGELEFSLAPDSPGTACAEHARSGYTRKDNDRSHQ
jgi:pimeloyl-ACP methyl ester carboxylesterase